jgi:hypothetical protein
MAVEKAEKRKRLFHQFANQPGHADLTEGRYFVCPLCRIGFIPEALDTDPPLLTLAHIIPESLGGTWTTLACAECNSSNGRGIEKDLLTKSRIRDWAHGRGELDVLMGAGGRVRAVVSRDPVRNHTDVRVRTPMASPAVQGLQAQLQNIAGGSLEEIPFGFRASRGNYCWAGVCQSAYLLMFHYFGYDFARNRSYRYLREQIEAPDEQPRRGVIRVFREQQAVELLEGKQAAVVFVGAPVKALMAVLRYRSPGNANEFLGVVMPGPGQPPLEATDLAGLKYAAIPYTPEYVAHQGSLRIMWDDLVKL